MLPHRSSNSPSTRILPEFRVKYGTSVKSVVVTPMPPLVVAAFYKFTALPDYVALRAPLLQCCLEQNIQGTILLAQEGINATIAGSRAGIDAVMAWLRRDPRLADLEHKESAANGRAFQRMKVRLKKEIVTLGVPGVDPTRRVGKYVTPHAWNALITEPDVVVIDTRNAYETSVGTFRGALDPQIESFRQFPDFVRTQLDPARTPRVALFCTGGIRCEKATAFMLEAGFREVYHLQGGILKYLEQVPREQGLWEGTCFVFDERVALDYGLGETGPEPTPETVHVDSGEPA
jgi:UPF0176 protein